MRSVTALLALATVAVLAQEDVEKRGGARVFGGDKRGGARAFYDEEKRGGGRAFLEEKRGGARAFFEDKRGGARPFYDLETRGGARAFYEEGKRGGGRQFKEKRGGARGFTTMKRGLEDIDFIEEFPFEEKRAGGRMFRLVELPIHEMGVQLPSFIELLSLEEQQVLLDQAHGTNSSVKAITL